MTTSQPSSRDISRKLVALIFGANFFGALIIFLYFSVIDPLPVGGVAVRSLETEDIVTFGIAGVVIFVRDCLKRFDCRAIRWDSWGLCRPNHYTRPI